MLCGFSITKPMTTIEIEALQDIVEDALFEANMLRTMKAYVRYRVAKMKERESGNAEPEGLLTKEFLSKYKHAPNPMEQLGAFVYTRTYSRFLSKSGRREFWWETVRRAVEYNCSLAQTSREEAEILYDNVYHMRQFLSGRTLWVGGTPVALQYPMANYNCAFTVIDRFSAYHDLFYLLMVGSGVGVRMLLDDAKKLPKLRTDSQHSAFETTVRYSGSVIAGAIMLLGIVAICAVNINAIQVETGRALYEIIVEDSDTLDALSGEFEIVDYSSYPVITIAAPMPPCGLVS